MKKLLTLALSLLMIMSVCLTGAIAEEGSVVIENNGRTTTYDSVPERVVVLSYSNAETMAALGLEDKVVAAFPGMYTLDDVLPEYQEAVAAMPFITEGLNSGTPNLETVLDQDPDFVLGTYYNFFPVNCGAPEDYEAAGANVYAQEGTYVAGATLENTYNDILNLGQIFHVEERAQDLVAEMRAQADEITTKLAETEPVSTFVYDSGEGTMLSIGGVGLENELLTLAGGANIFADQESRYFDASIENIIEANPSAIIVYDYSISADSEQKIEYLKSLSELSEVDAIKNDKIIVLPIYTVFPGMQNVRAIQLMAKGLHPELFEKARHVSWRLANRRPASIHLREADPCLSIVI